MFLCAACSACGIGHSRNDDRVVMGRTVLAGAELAGGRAMAACEARRLDGERVLAVCDGVGGSARGDRAATSAARELAEPTHPPETLGERLGRAARTVYAAERAHPADRRGCTVAAGALLQPAEHALTCTPFHAGDARVYRFRAPYLAQLTRDHTLAQEIRDARGGLPAPDGVPDPADDPVARRTVTRYLGRAPDNPFEEGRPFPLLAGDVLLVCSDGLWDALPPEELEGRLEDVARAARAGDLDAAGLGRHAGMLVRAAQEAGSTDDVSLVLAVCASDVPKPVPAVPIPPASPSPQASLPAPAPTTPTAKEP